MHRMLTSNWLVTLLAIVAALVISGVLIAIADEDVREASTYFFARPLDTVSAAWNSVAGAYASLFRGAVFDFQAPTLARAIRPITETMVAATPLIFAALGLGMGFRSGLFNIGAQGQVLMGAAAATYVGITWSLPVVVHVVMAVIAAMVVGGLWAGIAGFLKARTGASEVIVTIMLNWIAIWLVTYLLTTTVLRQGGSRPISPAVGENARLPLLFGEGFRLHWGFLLALGAAALVWWLMERSTIGFKFRAVGANMDAARTAGINVNMIFVFVMVTAGILAGLGGAAQILGTDKTLQAGSAGSIGFDAITVALLGRSRPLGTVLAALLFGALRAGSPLMQTVSNTPIDIVLVIQAVIVLFIAAPPLVRSIFFLPSPDRPRRVKEVAA
ncbi:ABC transporter permease [Occultella glacieicola]|uniref:ABC transporter permease n=2 Tax=Occultella glacieicola TaxID=2518684 RepID=A0ABY2E7Z5_9MICO|nr:ABC transporter permease [Occultella glacieicola]